MPLADTIIMASARRPNQNTGRQIVPKSPKCAFMDAFRRWITGYEQFFPKDGAKRPQYGKKCSKVKARAPGAGRKRVGWSAAARRGRLERDGSVPAEAQGALRSRAKARGGRGAGRGRNAGWHVQRGARDVRGASHGTETRKLKRGRVVERGAGRGWNAGWHVQRRARDVRGAWRGTKARKLKRGTGGRTGTASRPAPANASRAWPLQRAPRRSAHRRHPLFPRARRGSRAARPRARARRDRSP